MASHLAPPGASDVSAAGRSGVMPMQRRDACSMLAHTARVPTRALYPVIEYAQTPCFSQPQGPSVFAAGLGQVWRVPLSLYRPHHHPRSELLHVAVGGATPLCSTRPTL